MIVLHYIPSIDISAGGIGSYMQVLAMELGKLCELHIVTHKSENELTIDNCTIHYISNHFFSWVKTRKEFDNILDEISPDVFHSNCCWLPLSAMTAIWAKAKGYKVVYSPHGMLEPWIVKRNYWTKKLPAIIFFQRRGIKIADVIHCTADSERNNFLQLGWHNNVRVIANCVQVDRIKMKQSWHRKKNILFLSRVHVKKGVDFLIEAAAQLRDELNGYTIQIAGPGDESYISELFELAQKVGVGDIVKFIGPVWGNSKYDLYCNADLFVLPTHSENFGIVVAEALASGTPVLTTIGTPWKELLSEHCGWWTEIGTEPLVAGVKDFLNKTDAELEQMGRNGRQLVERRYGAKTVGKEYIEMYKWVMKSN